MVAGPGGATMERFILGAQKSTNQLKAVLAKLLPAAGGDRAGAGSSASAVDALLSDITDSLSQALTSLRLGALGTQRPTGQSSIGGCGGSSRRLAARRSGQRARTDGECRMIVLQNGVQDSYTWRKYGQKEILGARFPRSYFKCGRKSGCSARKQVQQCDADPYKLEITYLGAHTCDADDPPPPSSSSHMVRDPRIISSGTQRNAVDRFAPVAASVPSSQRYIGQPSPLLHLVPDMMTAGVLLPASAVVPAALSSTQYDPVPDDDTTAATLSMAEDEAELLLFIPSPACSQSELLHTEVAKMEHDAAQDDVCLPISDFMVVPEM
ncbi:unnamed protein product [Urochloa humidicola]